MDKVENKQEIIELYKELGSSDGMAEILQERYELYNIPVASLGRKIRNWLRDYRAEDELEVIKNNTTPAKVLLFDIETSPLVAYLWSKWQQGIQDDDIIEDWSILCFSAKWLFDDKMINFKLTKKELKTRDDSRIVKELWRLLDEADIVIAHNGQKFDLKKANSKFIENRLNLPSSYLVIDTLLHARKKFAMTSNKLDFLGEKLGVGRKMDTPKGMWRKIMDGDYDMLNTMQDYCDQDVYLLEDVYLTMRSYIQPHPNMGLFVTENVKACTCCGSENIKDTEKTYSTTVNTYSLLRCDDCGSLMRSKDSVLTLKQRKGILSSVPY